MSEIYTLDQTDRALILAASDDRLRFAAGMVGRQRQRIRHAQGLRGAAPGKSHDAGDHQG